MTNMYSFSVALFVIIQFAFCGVFQLRATYALPNGFMLISES